MIKYNYSSIISQVTGRKMKKEAVKVDKMKASKKPSNPFIGASKTADKMAKGDKKKAAVAKKMMPKKKK